MNNSKNFPYYSRDKIIVPFLVNYIDFLAYHSREIIIPFFAWIIKFCFGYYSRENKIKLFHVNNRFFWVYYSRKKIVVLFHVNDRFFYLRQNMYLFFPWIIGFFCFIIHIKTYHFFIRVNNRDFSSYYSRPKLKWFF